MEALIALPQHSLLQRTCAHARTVRLGRTSVLAVAGLLGDRIEAPSWCTGCCCPPAGVVLQRDRAIETGKVGQARRCHVTKRSPFFSCLCVWLERKSSHQSMPQVQQAIVQGGLVSDGTPYATIGFTTDGTPVVGGGFDGKGNAYDWEAMGNDRSGGTRVDRTLAWNGTTFKLIVPNQPNVIWAAGQTLEVAPNQSNTLNLAGAGVNGSQPDQQITLTFTDGSSVVWTQSFSDWCSPQYFGHEAIVSSQAYRNQATGSPDMVKNYIYGYSYTFPAGKTLASVTLPINMNVRLLDLQMTYSTPVDLSKNYTNCGIANGKTQVDNWGGFDGHGYYYYSEAIKSTIAWSGATFVLGPVPESRRPLANFALGAIISNDEYETIYGYQIVQLPQGDYRWLYLAGAAANGSLPNQTLTLTFTDGTIDTWVQSFSDWCFPQSYQGEAIIQKQTQWVNQVGNVHNQVNYVYGYAYKIPAGKQLASVKFPLADWASELTRILAMALI